MRFILFLFILFGCFLAKGQIREGFDAKTARDMAALCTAYTFQDLYNNDESIIPKGYKRLYTSSIVGMDNKYQVYKHNSTGIICFRGSTENAMSWVENMYSAMIPAKGVITVQEKAIPYRFAQDDSAAVHAGYALAIVLLSEGITNQIRNFNSQGIHDIIITGHSQGGALAIMTRAYLENLETEVLNGKCNFTTYAFANPMCGDKEFTSEYNSRYCNNNSAFSIINPSDPVPSMPLSYSEENPFSKESIAGYILNRKSFDPKKIGQDYLLKLAEDKLSVYVENSNALLSKLVSLKFGSVVMPEFVKEINYKPVGNTIRLEPFQYPEIKVTEAERIENPKISVYQKSEGLWYRKEPPFYQHKPYNYYSAVMREFLPDEYRKLRKKYLPENL